MRQEPEMSLEMAVRQVVLTVERHEIEIVDLKKLIRGNGDPREGVLWLATMQQESLGELQRLLAVTTSALKKHEINGHPAEARQGPWVRFAFDVGKSVTVWVILGFFALAVAGARVSIGN